MDVIQVGGSFGISGLYVIEDFGVKDVDVKIGLLKICFGFGWVKVYIFVIG